jgi:hypothetical protein
LTAVEAGGLPAKTGAPRHQKEGVGGEVLAHKKAQNKQFGALHPPLPATKLRGLKGKKIQNSSARLLDYLNYPFDST